MSSSQQKTLQDFVQLKNRNALTHVLRALVELGVIKQLKNGQQTAEQLAKELNCYPAVLGQLLDVASHSELIEKYGDDYALSTIARLIPERFLDFGDEHWQHLTFYCQTGAPLPICEEIDLSDLDYLVNKASEEWMLTPAALTAAEVLDLKQTRQGSTILEIGCGSAVFGVTLAHSDPTSRLTLVDTAFGLDRAKRTVESVGLQERVEYIYAEEWERKLEEVNELKGRSFDIVLLATQIHRMTAGDCSRFFQSIAPLIKASCELVLIDTFPGQESGDLSRSIFELELGLRTSRGRAHDPRQLQQLLEGIGFQNVQFAHLPAEPYLWGLVLAQK